MPNTNVGNVPVYSVGCPVAEAMVLRFRVRDNQGGKILLGLSAERSNEDLTFTAQVSESETSGYSDTTEAANESAVADISVTARTRRDYTVFLRPQVDKYFQILAYGGDVADIEIRNDGGLLDIVELGPIQ
jgi:hypothetical protein